MRVNEVADLRAPARRGRPPRYLLSGIAVCGTCEGPLVAGSQRGGDKADATRYRVLECRGASTGAPGSFHVAMSQEHLDQIVVGAVLTRVTRDGFTPPLAWADSADERAALRHEIKRRHLWLSAVRREAKKRNNFRVLSSELRIVLPEIEAAEDRLELLNGLDPHITSLAKPGRTRTRWNGMDLATQRHVIQALVVPRVNPVLDTEQGQRGLNARRVEFDWR